VKSPSRFAVAFVAILVGFFQTPVFAHATTKPSAKVIEAAMLSALKAQKSVQSSDAICHEANWSINDGHSVGESVGGASVH